MLNLYTMDDYMEAMAERDRYVPGSEKFEKADDKVYKLVNAMIAEGSEEIANMIVDEYEMVSEMFELDEEDEEMFGFLEKYGFTKQVAKIRAFYGV